MNNTEIFTKPDRPFLLITMDKDENISYSWLESEEELRIVARHCESYGDCIIDAIEIGSCRDIEL